MEVGRLELVAEAGHERPLPEKFVKEGLTFDDVLLVPAEIRRSSPKASQPRPG